MDTSFKLIAGRYAIQQVLQTGGMTTVYRARDLFTDSLVAVKRFDKDQHLPEIEREAFRREVDALQNLKHPHIVQMIDSGEDETGHFFVILELMKHDLIHERDADGPAFAGWDDFADLVVLPLLDALSYAHAMGTAHRDVKPANVLVSKSGIVKLADFGISKLKRTLQPRITLSNFMSPPFSPPEPDKGGYTYARDVYSIGALCLWAMSSTHLIEHEDVQKALTDFEGPDEIIEIIKKATSDDASRRHQSAALLLADVEREQALRRRYWATEGRPRCTMTFTKTALEAAKEELDIQDEAGVRCFIGEDMNLDSTVDRFIENPGKMNQRIRPGHYSILGNTLRYHIAINETEESAFILVNITKPRPHFLQRDRQSTVISPLTFDFKARLGAVEVDEAVTLLERTLEAFEAEKKEEERKNKETALFDSWVRVLDAKIQYEQDQCKPIDFTDSVVEESLVTLTTNGDYPGIELGQGRIIQTGDGHYIRGEVWDFRSGKVVLNCPGAPLQHMPSGGKAKLDQHALRVSVERQREAIDRIRAGTCTRSYLKPLLLNPAIATPPSQKTQLSQKSEELLDKSQCAALTSALTANDVLLVEGPPGTGKTRFIVALIGEELAKNPKTRILLSSQTHIAIDNALDWLFRYYPGISIVRIAKEQSKSIAECSVPFLLNHQMKAWREEVIKRSIEGLERWAKSHGIDPRDIKIGMLIRQIVTVRDRIANSLERIREEEERKKGLEQEKAKISAQEYEIEHDHCELSIQDLRDQVDSDEKMLERIQKELTSAPGGAGDLVSLSPSELQEWADALLGDTEEEMMAERLLGIQAAWIDRFNSVKEFTRPLLERSAVVAATCVGLAGVEETNDVDFDLCIIDESSKATAMESCVPMARAKRWILVGDSRQLPPFQEEVIARPKLREKYDLKGQDIGKSMFERFRHLLPLSSRVMLTTQYRMVEPIGRLISDCFYDGKLNSSRKEVDRQLCGLTGYAVNWISSRKLHNRTEQEAGTSFVNAAEAGEICRLLCETDDLLKKGGSTSSYSVLVLSGYGAQVQHLERRIIQIQQRLSKLKVECCTIDRVQGREANAVFFSVTRSNPDRTAGFLRALERTNVALSRARDLLCIIGDDSFVERAMDAEPLQRVLAHIQRWREECFMHVLDAKSSGGGGEYNAC